MKKTLLTILSAIIIHLSTFAQWTTSGSNIYPSTLTNNVGIGTSTPGSLLTIGSSTIRGAATLIGNMTNPPALSLTDSRTSGHSYTLYSGLSSAGDFNIYDQNTSTHRFLINSLGNIGIGSTDPLFKLQVESTIPGVAKFGTSSPGTTGNIAFLNGSNYGYGIIGVVRGTGGIGGDVYGLGYNPDPNTSFTSVLNWTSSNFVGIGTTYPSARLDVNGAIAIPGSSSNAMSRPLLSGARIVGEIAGYSESGYTLADGFLRLSAGGGNSSSTKSFIDLSGFSTVTDMNQNITLGTSGSERMRITQDGNILIGKASQTNTSYKLDINGSARANEIVVNSTGADYVFEPEYDLPKLSKVKEYIDKNHHLPQIPSAKEMQENGMNVGDLNTKLLQKVEELTLYIIEQNKQLDDQQKINQSLQKQIDQLVKRN